MKNKSWPISSFFFYQALLLFLFLNACSLMDMDRPIPPNNVLWKKNGISDEQKIPDFKQCAEISSHSSPTEEADEFDRCLLKRGYKFVPKPEGWRNVCALFQESLACKSASGEIRINPDE